MHIWHFYFHFVGYISKDFIFCVNNFNLKKYFFFIINNLIFTVPLLHVLSVHVRVLLEWPVWRTWASVCGLPITDGSPVPSHCTELINLLDDPCALLLKFILLTPLHLDLGNYIIMVI